MKLRKLFAAILALTLLLTACGSAGEDATQTTDGTTAAQPYETEQTSDVTMPTQPYETETGADTETTLPPDLSDTKYPISSILLSSANGLSGQGSFIYITYTQIMTGQTTYADMIKGNPLQKMENIKQLQITEIPKEAFEELCAKLWELRFDLLPQKVEKPDNIAIEDASDFYLKFQDSFSTAYVSQGYAATHYHEGFAAVWNAAWSGVEALIEQYAPATPAEVKPIASITLTSNGVYPPGTSVTHISPTQVMTGSQQNMILPYRSNPLDAPGSLPLKVADIPEGIFEELCAQLWALRFDLLPAKVTPPQGMWITDNPTYYLTVCFEDGTSFTSEGYAATYYHDGYNTVWRYLSTHADVLMEQYENPEKELKGITAVLNYTYNASAAQNGGYGYRCYYYSLRDMTTWQTRNTPVDLTNPLNTKNQENRSTKGIGNQFNTLCQGLRARKPETLPAIVEPDPNNIIYDGDMQYIVIYFEDGTTFTSEGYCATEYNEQFNAVWDWLQLFRASIGMP